MFPLYHQAESLQQQWKRKLRKIIKKSHSQLGQVKIILQLHVHYVLCMVENWFFLCCRGRLYRQFVSFIYILIEIYGNVVVSVFVYLLHLHLVLI